ncbi:MAG: alanine racemase [Armatimonadetes bacterium]|nr:alanine racemase [Armatimonadota bacterium]
MVNDIWVEVNLKSLMHNLRRVRGLVGDDVKIMAVVKANGYGHGYVEPSGAFLDAGANALGVTRLDEGLTLRNAGISAPILLFAPIQPTNAPDAVEADLDLTISDLFLARAISRAAVELKKTARVHVKIDSGMGRVGITSESAPEFFNRLKELPGIDIAGTYTHFATTADSDLEPSHEQFHRFKAVLDELKAAGVGHGLAHAANSAGMIRLPESQLDMVRPGTILYGQYPSEHVPRSLDLLPTWKLKTRVCQVTSLPSGAPIGYGAEFITRRPTRTAIVPIGFADGYTLAPEGPIYRQSLLKLATKRMKRSLTMEIRGKKAPVIGRVAMQMTILDVTDIGVVEVGDEVIVPAMRIPTSALIPRVYFDK